jgi:DNA-binding GntR family transcriptional regulator
MRTTNSLPRPHAALSPQNSHQRAAPYIRRLILDGILPPGVRVPQDDIASALGLSRNPIREALIALNAEGWITIEPNRGAFVNTFDKSTIADHFEICAFIHTLAMRHGLSLGGDELISKLEEILNSLTPKTDVTEAGRLTVEFHGRIISSAKSSRIVAVHRANSTLVPGNFFDYVPNARTFEREGMLSIVKAAKNRDMDAVAEAYRRLMGRLAKEVTQLFKDRGLFEHKGANAA